MILPTTVHFQHYFLEFTIKIIDNIVNAIYITYTRCIITKYKKPDYVYGKSMRTYTVHRSYIYQEDTNIQIKIENIFVFLFKYRYFDDFGIKVKFLHFSNRSVVSFLEHTWGMSIFH